MPFIKTNSKWENGSTCSKDGCENRIEFRDEYIFDTDGKKGYCLKHDEINSKVAAKPTGKGFYRIPISKAPEILNVALGLSDTVLKRVDGTVDPSDQLQLVESMFKTVCSSFKADE